MVQHRIVLINEYVAKGLSKVNRQVKDSSTSHGKLAQAMGEVDHKSKDLLTSFTKMRWMLVNVAMATAVVVGAFKAIQTTAGKLESSLVSLEIISKTSGESFEKVREQIRGLKEEFGGLISESSLLEGAMLFMKTGLPFEEFDRWVNAVADGSAAMGEDFNIQLGRVTKGLIRLEPRVLDNIGAEMKLNLLYRETAKALGKTIPALTVVERRQAMLNETIKITSKFQGSFIAQQDTLNGKLSMLKVSFEELGIAIGEAGLLDALKGSVESITEFVDAFNEIDKDTLQALIKLGEVGLFVILGKLATSKALVWFPKVLAGLASAGAALAGMPVVASIVAALGAIALLPDDLREKLGLDFNILTAIFPPDSEIEAASKEFVRKTAAEMYKEWKIWEEAGLPPPFPFKIPELPDLQTKISGEFIRQYELLGRQLSMVEEINSSRRKLLELEYKYNDLLKGEGKTYEKIMGMEELSEIEKQTLLDIEKKILTTKIEQAEQQVYINAETEKLKQLNKELDNQYREIGDKIDDMGDKIFATEKKIQTVLGRRFRIRGIAETEISHLIRQQELELTRARFATLGLGTAEEFLSGASLLTADSINTQTEAVRNLIRATEDGQDRYEAWRSTLTETIRALLISSQDIDRDVTAVVRKAQTELLSITRFDREGGDQFTAMEANLDALGMAQDIFFGSEKEKLEYSEKLREDRISGMNESAEQAISNLELERSTLTDLMNREQEWIAQQKDIRAEIEKNREAMDRYRESQAGVSAGYGRGGRTPIPGSEAGVVPTYMGEPMTYSGGVWKPTVQDFISRPGQPIQAFSPDDTIIGTKNAGDAGGKSTIGTLNINIQGGSFNERTLAIEIERRMRSLA